jgi:GTPase
MGTLEADLVDIDELNELDTAEKTKSDIVAHFMIRKRPKSIEDLIEVRVAVVGNVDAGKVKKKCGKMLIRLLTNPSSQPCWVC